MATRCLLFASLLLLWLALAECSIYRTTIIETIDENDESHSGCQGESMQHLSSCRKCIQQGWQQMMSGDSSQSRQRRCCEQLQGIREDCRCQALRQIAQEHSSYGRSGQEEKSRRAQGLAFMCGIQHCSIHGVPY